MSTSLPQLNVDSVTGIELSLPVAGPGARAFAFIIDWHIRLVLALAWYVVATLIYNRAFSLQPPAAYDHSWFAVVQQRLQHRVIEEIQGQHRQQHHCEP